MAVVIATRDRWTSLDATLRRLARVDGDPRVVVVDNGSSDGTPARVRERHPRVDVIELGANHGGHARTIGARGCAEPLIAFCDDDSWWSEDALTRAAALFHRHPRLGLLAARVLVGDRGRPDPVSDAMALSLLGTPPDMPGPAVLGFVACGAIVRRSPFLAAGGFDARLGIGGEEEVLALDMAVAGWGLAYAESVVAHHHPSPLRDPGRRRRVQTRNALWAAWLRRSSDTALERTLRALLAAAGDGDVRSGTIDALRGAAWVVRERRSLPAAIEAAARVLEGGAGDDPVRAAAAVPPA
jgi:GT2 family glycosyltransferase